MSGHARIVVMPAAGAALELREVPLPELSAGEVLLETVFSEVCGTDVHLHHGRLGGVPYPIIPGHVSVGRVKRIGGGSGALRDVDGRTIEEGTLVTFLDVHETCHRCWHCLVAKTSTRCPSRRVYGVTYSANEGLLGGWADHILLKAGVKVLVLPPGVTPERMIAGGCALPTAVHAIDRAEIRLGDTVVVQGAGPVGLSAAALARLSGAGQVYVFDRHANRLEMATAFGADAVFRVEESGAHVEQVRRVTGGRGVDVTIEATGFPSAVRDGIDVTRDGGRYVVVGHYTDTGETTINPHRDINRKQLEIRGVAGTDYSHFHRALGVLARHGGAVGGGWESQITKRYRLEDVAAALSDVERGVVVKAIVDPRPATTGSAS